MKRRILIAIPCLAIAGSLVFCTRNATDATTQNYTQYVDPFIGTGGHGHVFLVDCVKV